jgi:hypothetical protein
MTYALVGFLGGNVALLLFLLQNTIRLRADLLAMHMGEPERQIPLTLEMWIVYAPFSFVGWLLVGVPMALLFPARSIKIDLVAHTEDEFPMASRFLVDSLRFRSGLQSLSFKQLYGRRVKTLPQENESCVLLHASNTSSGR